VKKLFVLALIIFSMSFAAIAQAKTSHKIKDVQAFLMYEENGELSKNILGGNFILFNAIIGEGDAEGHSSSTLVKVVITTDGKEIKTDPIIQFSAVSKNGKRVRYNKTFEYQFPTSGASKTFVPFLLHDTGCDVIVMTMKLVEKNKPTVIYQTVKKEIPFNCGE
jgi:hypothetical protein